MLDGFTHPPGTLKKGLVKPYLSTFGSAEGTSQVNAGFWLEVFSFRVWALGLGFRSHG